MKPKITKKAEWHYKRVGREYGPVTYGELRVMALDGRLHEKNDYIRKENEKEWTLVGNVEGLISNETKPEDLADWRLHHSAGWLPIKLVGQTSVSAYLIFGCLGLISFYWSMFGNAASTVSPQMLNLIKILGVIFLFATSLSALEIIYKAWKVIRPFGGKISGGFAVFLMLLPGINLLASFYIFPMWAHTYTMVRKSDSRLKSLPYTPVLLFIPACISPWLGFVCQFTPEGFLMKCIFLYACAVYGSWLIALLIMALGINGFIKLYWKQREIPEQH